MADNKNPSSVLSYTARSKTISRILPTNVIVESTMNPDSRIEINAIWDTGATSSLITPEVAAKLNLKPVSKVLMSTPSDKDVPANVYLINIEFPNGVKVINIQSLEGTPNGCDMLIGMDVITLGDFAVSNFNGQTMFSFRIPSMTHIDFCNPPYLIL